VNCPFPSLLKYVEEFKFEDQPEHIHGHIPFVVILIKVLT